MQDMNIESLPNQTWLIVKQTVRLYMLNLNYLEKLLVEWTLNSNTEHKYIGTVMGV